MTFRTRLVLVFTAAVVASVGLVEWLGFRSTRDAFERAEAQRVDALLAQFRREFARRGEAIVHAVNGIAASDTVLNIAIASDRAPEKPPLWTIRAGWTCSSSWRVMGRSFLPPNGRPASDTKKSGSRAERIGSRGGLSCGARNCPRALRWRWLRFRRRRRATGNCISPAGSGWIVVLTRMPPEKSV